LNPVRYNLRIIRGDDFVGRYRFTTENHETGVRTPINLAGWSVEATLTEVYDAEDVSLIATIEDAANGIVKVELPSETTIVLPKRNANWYLTLISPTNVRTTYMQGLVLMLTPGEIP